MKDSIQQIDIAFNGAIVILGEVDGHTVHWTFTQQEFLELLRAQKMRID